MVEGTENPPGRRRRLLRSRSDAKTRRRGASPFVLRRTAPTHCECPGGFTWNVSATRETRLRVSTGPNGSSCAAEPAGQIGPIARTPARSRTVTVPRLAVRRSRPGRSDGKHVNCVMAPRVSSVEYRKSRRLGKSRDDVGAIDGEKSRLMRSTAVGKASVYGLRIEPASDRCGLKRR